jgi:hypothetical protein
MSGREDGRQDGGQHGSKDGENFEPSDPRGSVSYNDELFDNYEAYEAYASEYKVAYAEAYKVAYSDAYEVAYKAYMLANKAHVLRQMLRQILQHGNTGM